MSLANLGWLSLVICNLNQVWSFADVSNLTLNRLYIGDPPYNKDGKFITWSTFPNNFGQFQEPFSFEPNGFGRYVSLGRSLCWERSFRHRLWRFVLSWSLWSGQFRGLDGSLFLLSWGQKGQKNQYQNRSCIKRWPLWCKCSSFSIAKLQCIDKTLCT